MPVQNKTLHSALKRLIHSLLFLVSVFLSVWIIAVQAGCFTMRTPDQTGPQRYRKKDRRSNRHSTIYPTTPG